MLGRRAAGDAETLRFGRDRLRIRPWTDEPNTGHLALLTPGAAVAVDFAAQAVDAAIARGYRFIRTSALSSIEAEPFLKVGFEPCQQLALVMDGLRWMARCGATQAWVNTPMHNTGALRLYERLGFELVPPGLQVLELSVDER